jgi:hypothetical protein
MEDSYMGPKVLNTTKKNPPILAVVHYGGLWYIAFYDCN